MRHPDVGRTRRQYQRVCLVKALERCGNRISPVAEVGREVVHRRRPSGVDEPTVDLPPDITIERVSQQHGGVVHALPDHLRTSRVTSAFGRPRRDQTKNRGRGAIDVGLCR